jgi:hypothetical protein
MKPPQIGHPCQYWKSPDIGPFAAQIVHIYGDGAVDLVFYQKWQIGTFYASCVFRDGDTDRPANPLHFWVALL